MNFWAKFFHYLKEKWALLISLFLLGILLFIEIRQIILSTIIIAILIVVSIIFQLIQNSQKDDQSNIFKKSFDVIAKQLLQQKSESEEVVKVLGEQKRFIEVYKKETENTKQFLKELLGQSVITNDDIMHNMEDTNIYVLYCYATPIRRPRYLPYFEGVTYRQRKYLAFLESIGFIRLPHQTVFLTTENRLKPKLRELSKLKEYLMRQFKPLLKEDWELYLKDLKANSKYAKLYKNRSKESFDTLKANIILLRAKLNNKSLGILYREIFPKQIHELFQQEAKYGLSLPEEKKSRIKRFIITVSFEHIFHDESTEDLDKIVHLESNLKLQLKINKITDYAQRPLPAIIRFFAKHFPEEKAVYYSKLLKEKSENYHKALKAIGI